MNIKNTIKIVPVLVAIFISQQTITAFAYSDVDSSTKNYKEIQYLEDKNLLPKFPGNTFNPEDKVTPVDFYTMLLEYAGATTADYVNLPFTDMNGYEWYAPYIQTAVDLKILNPSETNFLFQDYRRMPKIEIVRKLFDALGIGTSKFFDKNAFPFSDLDPNGNIAPYAFKAYEIGIDTQGGFGIGSQVSKAELARYFYLIDKYESSTGKTLKKQQNITVNVTQSNPIDSEAFEVFMDIWNTVHDKYYYKDEINDDEMVYGAIKGAIETLQDHYTEFTKPKEGNSVSNSLRKEYEGIGMSVEMLDGKITVVSPFKKSPAEKAGIKPKDVILKIDGNSTEGLTLSEAVEFIKGKSGSTVTLTIQRENKVFDVRVTRGFIINKTVELTYIPKSSGYIANINMYTFGEDTLKEFIMAAQQIHNKQTQENNVKGVILDLRNNPGGYLDIAIDLNGMFFDTDKIVTVLEDNRGKKVSYKSTYEGIDKEYSTGMGLLSEFKTVVLINKGSASASEILAGALKDHNRAKIIGEQSFGKGTVQELSYYNDNSAFKLTIAKWTTPNGNEVNKKGIAPDKIVTNTGSEDTQLNTALGEF